MHANLLSIYEVASYTRYVTIPTALCTYVAFFLLIQGHVKMAVQILRISSMYKVARELGKGYFSGCLLGREDLKNCCV